MHHIGIPYDQLLKIDDENGRIYSISSDQLEAIECLPASEVGNFRMWFKHLEKFGIFFSSPLDLDLLMLEHFPEAYKSVANNSAGPRIPECHDLAYKAYLDKAALSVMGANLENSKYPKELYELFPWYRYLFLSKSKPATHLQALQTIQDQYEIVKSAPSVLKRLLKFCRSKIEFQYDDS